MSIAIKMTYCIYSETPSRIATIRTLFPAAEFEKMGDGYYNVTTTNENGDTDRFTEYCETHGIPVEFV